MLILEAVEKRYADPRPRTVLRRVDLAVREGEYVAIMGESGSGKSTLLNLIAGLDRPDAGRIALDGLDYGGLDDEGLTLLRRSRLGFVFQAFHILPHLDLLRNVALPLVLNGVGRQETAERARAMLEAVGLGERAASMPRELSGGEMQRVAIARALVHGPRLLLADEPTGNLDADSAAQVLALLRGRLADSGASGILVTHSAAAARTADRVLTLDRDGLRPSALP